MAETRDRYKTTPRTRKTTVAMGSLVITTSLIGAACKPRTIDSGTKGQFSQNTDTLEASFGGGLEIGAGVDTITVPAEPKQVCVVPIGAGSNNNAPAEKSVSLTSNFAQQTQRLKFTELPAETRRAIARIIDSGRTTPVFENELSANQLAWNKGYGNQGTDNSVLALAGEKADPCDNQSFCSIFSLFDSTKQAAATLSGSAQAKFESIMASGGGGGSGNNGNTSTTSEKFLVARIRNIAEVETTGANGRFQISPHIKEDIFPDDASDAYKAPAGQSKLQESLNNFVSICGTKFISGRISGKELYIFARYEGLDEAQYKKLKGDVNASSEKLGKLGSGNANADVESTVANLLNQGATTIVLFGRSGSSTDNTFPTTVDGAIERVKSFEKSANTTLLYRLDSYQVAASYTADNKTKVLWALKDFSKMTKPGGALYPSDAIAVAAPPANGIKLLQVNGQLKRMTYAEAEQGCQRESVPSGMQGKWSVASYADLTQNQSYLSSLVKNDYVWSSTAATSDGDKVYKQVMKIDPTGPKLQRTHLQDSCLAACILK